MTQYVLRAYCFGYNDENFYICGTRINEIFEDRDAAEKAYRRAQLDYLHSIDLAEHEKFFNGDESFVRKMDEFIHAKTGKHIIGDNGWVEMGTDTHTGMSDDDLFEFGEVGELHAFKLISFDDEPIFHALWNPSDEKYVTVQDEGFRGLVYGSSRDELMKLVEGDDVAIDWETFERNGTLEELSENPVVLRQLIDQSDEIEYDEEAGILRFEYAETKHVVALNALLKEPIFEVRELSLDEIKETEDSIHKYYGGSQKGILAGCALTLLKLAAWLLIPVAVFTGIRCTFGTCENYFAAFGSTAGVVLKWLMLIAIGAIVLIYGLIKFGAAMRKKR